MKNQGFTLIELLVVVAIIGILAAIAIPQFQAYRQRSYDATAKSDARNLLTATEAYLVDNELLVDCSDAADCQSAYQGYEPSPGVVIEVTTFHGLSQNHIDIVSSHESGSGTTHTFCSSQGKIDSHV